MDRLIGELQALNNESIKNVKIDIEEIVNICCCGDSLPFALSNIWDTDITKEAVEYAKDSGYTYALSICINKGYHEVYLEVLKKYIEYYISILEEEYRRLIS